MTKVYVKKGTVSPYYFAIPLAHILILWLLSF